MSSVTLRWLSKKCQEANKQGHEAKPMSLAKMRTLPRADRVGVARAGLGNPHGGSSEYRSLLAPFWAGGGYA
jgi:hypothetical protein